MAALSFVYLKEQIGKAEGADGLQRLLHLALHAPKRLYAVGRYGLIRCQRFADADIRFVQVVLFAEGRFAFVLQQQTLGAAAGAEHLIKQA